MGASVLGRLRPFRLCARAMELALRQGVESANRGYAPRGMSEGNIMARKHTASDDIVEIEREIGELMHDIETRVGRLNALTRRGAAQAANGASEFVSEAISEAAD